MTYRQLTPGEIESLPDDFYADVDKLGLGERYTPGMAGYLIGAFDGDELVGVQAAVLIPHCGPLWVRRDRRGRSTALRAGLWTTVRDTFRSWGIPHAIMLSREDAPQIQHIISRLPHRKVGTAYLMEI